MLFDDPENDERGEANPTDFDQATDTSRILLHAGDLTSHGSYAQFREEVLANRLLVSADKVEYRFGPAKNHLEATLYDGDRPEKFSLPRINGQSVDLRPKQTFQSPYLNGEFGSDQVEVTVDPVKRVLDFSK
jgi:hypothetical protein